MDIHDGLVVAICGAISTAVSSVLDWFDRQKVNDMNVKVEKQETKLDEMEKSYNRTLLEIRSVDTKIDKLLETVSEMRGEMKKK